MVSPLEMRNGVKNERATNPARRPVCRRRTLFQIIQDRPENKPRPIYTRPKGRNHPTQRGSHKDKITHEITKRLLPIAIRSPFPRPNSVRLPSQPRLPRRRCKPARNDPMERVGRRRTRHDMGRPRQAVQRHFSAIQKPMNRF